MKYLIICLIIIIMIAAVFAAAVYIPYNSRESVTEIANGASASGIAETLYENGVISNKLIFRIYVTLRGREQKLSFGEYHFPPRLSLSEVVTKLETGKVKLHPVTITEGLTISETAARYSKASHIDYDKFISICSDSSFAYQLTGLPVNKLEGFLYPDTYLFPKQVSEEYIIRNMVRTLASKITTVKKELGYPCHYTAEENVCCFGEKSGLLSHFSHVGSGRCDIDEEECPSACPYVSVCEETQQISQPENFFIPGTLQDIYEVLILASIVEKEATFDDEKPLIAGVYHNRLRRGMRLQADPTVAYALEQAGIVRRSKIYYRDLQIDSPYNTYRNKGLPPTPICSPSIKSIKAVLNPAETDYLFFFSNNRGRHIFSKTYREHLNGLRKLRHSN